MGPVEHLSDGPTRLAARQALQDLSDMSEEEESDEERHERRSANF